MEFEEIASELGYILRVPAEWLYWPNWLNFLLLPFIFNTYGFYSLLKRIGIFKSQGPNLMLACLISFVFLPYGRMLLIPSIFMAAFFGFSSWFGRIVFILLVLFLFLYLIPLLSSLPTSP